MSQCDLIIKYLQEHIGIDPMIAEDEFGCRRLSARIMELRERGYNILSLRKEVFNRFGKKCIIAEYRLLEDENETG